MNPILLAVGTGRQSNCSLFRPLQVAINLRCTWAKQSEIKATASIKTSTTSVREFQSGKGIMPHCLTAEQHSDMPGTGTENGLP
jgi:hypothetical protein